MCRGAQTIASHPYVRVLKARTIVSKDPAILSKKEKKKKQNFTFFRVTFFTLGAFPFENMLRINFLILRLNK
jgi:hypothetical protein